MAVEIKSGASSDLQTVDAVSKAARVTLYDSDGQEVVPSVPVVIVVANVTALNNDLIASFDASAYKFISVQFTGTWVGSVQFQGSNDNGTFVPIVVQKTGVVLDPYTLTATANGVIKVPVLFKFLRVRVTAYTSGTVEGFAFGFRESNDTGQISATGTVALTEETTKVIGTVNVAQAPSFITGTITASDTNAVAPAGDGVLVSGAPSANSTVVLEGTTEDSAWIVEISGTLGGATFYFEASVSSTNGVDGGWTNINGRQTGVVNTILAGNTTVGGVYRGNTAGTKYFRVRAVGGTGTNATVYIRNSYGTGVVFLNASIPAGTNVIGSVGVAAGQTINVGNFPAASPISSATSSIAIGHSTVPLIPLFILGAAGAVNVNSVSIRNVPAILRTVVFTNYAATARHFKLYNTASVPVAGAGTPVIVCSLPSGGTLVYPLPIEGFAFSLGIGATMTLGAANNDTTPTATAPDFSVSLIST